MSTKQKTSVRKKSSSRKKTEPKKLSRTQKIAIGAGVTAGVSGLAFYLAKSRKNIKKATDEQLQKELEKLENENKKIYNENENIGANVLFNVVKKLGIPYSPVPVLEQKKYNKNQQRIEILKNEISQRKKDKKRSVTDNLEQEKQKIHDIQDKINNIQENINKRLWDEGYSVYMGFSSASGETQKYITELQNEIEKLKKSSMENFKQIKEFEKILSNL